MIDDTHIPLRSRFTFTVIGTDTDVFDCLTPQALFSFKQEAASLHAKELGMTGYVDRANGVWLLRRSRAKWFRRPSYRDELTVETWSRGVSLASFLRDYKFYINGDMSHPTGVGSSEWIIADKVNHRPLRPVDVMPLNTIADLRVDEAAIEEKSPRLKPPDLPLVHIMEREIGYSEIDHNDHVNNTFYLRYGLDAVVKAATRFGLLSSTKLDFTGMDVVYMRELSCGEKLDLHVAREKNYWFVEGRKADGKPCFYMKLSR